MAQRRMFSKRITDTDLFTDMPLSTQCLYFHLNMNGDDDGFVDNTKRVQKMIGASDDDLKLLFAKEFLIPFESGVVVIKDWKIHNYIRGDRYQETVYRDEKSQLILDKTGKYQLDIPPVDQMSYQRETQVRLGKDRLGKDRLGEVNKDKGNSVDEIIDYYQQEMGEATPTIQTDLEYDLKDFNNDVELLKMAMDISVKQGVRKYVYFRTILRNWEKEGIKTIGQVKELNAKREKNNNIQETNKRPSTDYENAGF